MLTIAQAPVRRRAVSPNTSRRASIHDNKLDRSFLSRLWIRIVAIPSVLYGCRSLILSSFVVAAVLVLIAWFSSQNASPQTVENMNSFSSVSLAQFDFMDHEAIDSAENTVVLVRSYNPSLSTIARILTWAEQLRPIGVRVIVSIDETLGSRLQSGPAFRRFEDMMNYTKVDPNLIEFHLYNSSIMAEEYPVLTELMSDANRLPFEIKASYWMGLRKPPLIPSLAWGFSIEAVNLWVQKQPVDAFDYLWVLEDDVAFTGSFDQLILRTKDLQQDLLASGVFRLYWPFWPWIDIRTDGYRMFTKDNTFYNKEFARRFSRKYLDDLHILGKNNVTGWSEMASVTICLAHPNCTFSEIPADLIGDPFRWSGRVSEYRLRSLFRNPDTQDRLYHALKW